MVEDNGKGLEPGRSRVERGGSQRKMAPDHGAGSPSSVELEVASYQFTGPIPHPSILEGYEKVVPGSAARIIGAFTVEGDHRRELERAESRRTNRGQWMGFSLALIFIGVSTFLIWQGHAVAGTILGTLDLVALVAVFVLNRPPGEEELQTDPDL